MKKKQIKFKKTRLDAKAPLRATDGSAAFDLFAAQVEEIGVGQIRCHSGIAVEIPRGFVGKFYRIKPIDINNWLERNYHKKEA